MNIIEKLGITPGPWELCEVGDKIKRLCPAHDNVSLLTVSLEYNSEEPTYFGSVFNHGDAHLIAAAPEMLEALIDLILFHEKYEACYQATGRHHIKAVNKAIDTIEKATGLEWEKIEELYHE